MPAPQIPVLQLLTIAHCRHALVFALHCRSQVLHFRRYSPTVEILDGNENEAKKFTEIIHSKRLNHASRVG